MIDQGDSEGTDWKALALAFLERNNEILDRNDEYKRIRSQYWKVLTVFDEFYECSECDKRGARTYLKGCKNPLHFIHDVLIEEMHIQDNCGGGIFP